MIKVQKRRVKLKVCRREDKRGKKRWVVRYARIKKDGKYEYAKKDWVIGPVSYQPKPFFHTFVTTIYFWVGKIEKDKCFKTMEPKIKIALSGEGAPAFGCKFEKNEFGGRTWLLNGKPYADFAIVDFEKHRNDNYFSKTGLPKLAEKLRDRRPVFRKMEKESKAMFRIAIVVLKNGLWGFVPGKTLPEDKRHE